MEHLLCESRILLKTERGLIVEIAFSGRFGLGSEGNLHADEMRAYVTEVVKKNFPVAVLFNLTSMHYEFGDAIGSIAVPLIIEKKSFIPVCVVAREKTARALQCFFEKRMIFGIAGFKLFHDSEQGLEFLREASKHAPNPPSVT